MSASADYWSEDCFSATSAKQINGTLAFSGSVGDMTILIQITRVLWKCISHSFLLSVLWFVSWSSLEGRNEVEASYTEVYLMLPNCYCAVASRDSAKSYSKENAHKHIRFGYGLAASIFYFYFFNRNKVRRQDCVDLSGNLFD